VSNDKAKAKHVFKKWAASLASKDRSKNSLSDNFGELFYDLWASSVSFSDAENILDDAVKEHLPNNYVANTTYKYAKANNKHGNQSFNEYFNSWKDLIRDRATESFYAQYPIDGVEKKEEKKFGNMSIQEYNKQRKYADSFPILDTDALKKKREVFMKEELATLEDDNGKA